jgi:hypothetical protein
MMPEVITLQRAGIGRGINQVYHRRGEPQRLLRSSFEHQENPIPVNERHDSEHNPKWPFNVACKGHRRVFIPTRHCTNLGAAIYLLLYDRLVKRYLSGVETALPLGEVLAETRGWPVNNPIFEAK